MQRATKFSFVKLVPRVFLAILVILLYSCNDSGLSLSFKNPIAATAVRFADSVVWHYDPTYYRIPYPNGDVPGGGACTDVVIRVLRANGIDLQKEVHEDMVNNFDKYPNIWGLKDPDPSIDHRRVPNLMTYFTRKGYEVNETYVYRDFRPGDIVCWNLNGGINHIGIYLEEETVFHNMGPISCIEKGFLNRFLITGHYRIPLKIN